MTTRKRLNLAQHLSELVQSFLIGKKYVFKDRLIIYRLFTEDGEDVGTAYQPKAEEPIVTPVPSVQELPQQAGSTPSKDKNITRLHARQQELAMQSHV